MPRTRRIDEWNGPFSEHIRARMRELGLDRLEDFADYATLGATTVYNLVYGRTSSTGELVKPSIDTLARLAAALDTPLHELVYHLVPDAQPQTESDSPLSGVISLPLGVVGSPRDHPAREPHLLVEEGFARGKRLAAFRVAGHAMADGDRPIRDGDRILVDEDDRGHDLSDVVARLANGRLICRTRKDEATGTFLVSRNLAPDDGSPAVLPLDETTTIVGRIVRIEHDDIE